MSKRHRKDCQTLKYIEHFLILCSTITGCLSISAFASLFGIPVGLLVLQICAIAAGIKKYKSMINKKKKKNDKIVFLANLN